MRALAIIPTYNERENLRPLFAALLNVEPAIDVMIVDDDSPDGTGQVADEVSATTGGRIRVMHRRGKRGLGSAYMAGFQYAVERGYDCAIQMDADFSHRPEDIPSLLRALERADVVVGSRKIRGGRIIGWSPIRHVLSRAGNLYARWLLGLRLRDCTSGFKCVSRRALEAIDLRKARANGYGFLEELNYEWTQLGMRIVEVPIIFRDRVRGDSKMTAGIALEAAVALWRLRFPGAASLDQNATAYPVLEPVEQPVLQA